MDRSPAFGIVVLAVFVGLAVLSVAAGGLAVSEDEPSANELTTTAAQAFDQSPLQNATVVTEDGLTISLSRTETVVNTPVTLAASGADDGEWTVTDPAGDSLDIRAGRAGTVSVQPERPGNHTVRFATEDAVVTATFSARERTAGIEEFAPRLHFHEDGPYRPTRIEAIVENAVLRQADTGTVDSEPTIFDIANRDGSYYLELEGSQEEFPAFQAAFSPTIYANHIPNVSFEGDTYDMYQYWFIYTYDPKHSFARLGDHQADVEQASILVDQDGDPAYVAPAAHGGMAIAPYDQFAEDGRVNLYPEHRSHATYLRDSSQFVGNDLQVYEYWTDDSAACHEVADFESTFYSEFTGSAETWNPDGDGGTPYELIELTGGELWASYEGGFAAAPGSITGPHQRTEFEEPSDRLVDGCPDHEHVVGSITVDSVTIDDGAGEVSSTVENQGGKPHEFWVSVEADESVLAAEPVAVGTTRWASVHGTNSTTLSFETETEDLSVELWLHPPDTREAFDRKDSVAIEDGAVADADRELPRWLQVGMGVLVVTAGSWLYERRRRRLIG